MAGFAFLEYDNLRDAEQAVNDLNNKDFLGERIMVEFAKPPRSMMDDRFGGPPRGGYGGGGYGGGYGGGGGYGAPPPRGYDRPPARGGSGYRLTISGLREGTSWQDLKDFGRQSGAVGFADVDRRDPTIGYIEYSSRYDAEDAVRKLDGTECNGAVVTVKDENGASSGGRDRDEGYSRQSTRDRYDERDRRRSPSPRRRSPSPRRSRSPRRRSPTPDAGDKGRDRSRSPVRRERSADRYD
ncbi:RNA-binding protein [Rhodotorula paludigena]|uniref:RNA-binding protein n=1 Tax=Rhodotorula paludigena TaxID=86838 RepID=UPI0031707D95